MIGMVLCYCIIVLIVLWYSYGIMVLWYTYGIISHELHLHAHKFQVTSTFRSSFSSCALIVTRAQLTSDKQNSNALPASEAIKEFCNFPGQLVCPEFDDVESFVKAIAKPDSGCVLLRLNKGSAKKVLQACCVSQGEAHAAQKTLTKSLSDFVDAFLKTIAADSNKERMTSSLAFPSGFLAMDTLFTPFVEQCLQAGSLDGILLDRDCLDTAPLTFEYQLFASFLFELLVWV